MGYVATVNIPGYLPMDEEPAVFDTAHEAWEYLALERAASTDEDWDSDGDTVQALYDAARTNAEGTVYGPTPGYDGNHDLGLAYSVALVEDGA